MPGFLKPKKKKTRVPQKSVKLPTKAADIKKNTDVQGKAVPAVDKKVEELCDELMSSPWHNYTERPKTDLRGFFCVCQWYPNEKSWVILFIGHGSVRAGLEDIFRGRPVSPLAFYVSSTAREVKERIWVKWIKDPYYPYEAIHEEDVISYISAYYNLGETPAYNLPDDAVEEDLPPDFSIVPDWQAKPKPQKTAQKAKKAS